MGKILAAKVAIFSDIGALLDIKNASPPHIPFIVGRKRTPICENTPRMHSAITLIYKVLQNRPFYPSKQAVLQAQTACFMAQNGSFCKPVYHCLRNIMASATSR